MTVLWSDNFPIRGSHEFWKNCIRLVSLMPQNNCLLRVYLANSCQQCGINEKCLEGTGIKRTKDFSICIFIKISRIINECW